MADFINNCIRELFEELRFAPLKQKLNFMDTAEDLYWLISEEQEYPFEFICFKITDYRPRNMEEAAKMIPGSDLLGDIPLFILRLSEDINEPVQFIQEQVYSVKQLSEKLGISTKTVNRWRDKGLIFRSLIFQDGKRRLGIAQSSLDKFSKRHPKLIDKAVKFTQLNEAEKDLIVSKAQKLVKLRGGSRKKIISAISQELGRAEETVRYTLLNYENKHPQEHIFDKPSGVVSPHEGAKIYKLFQQGSSVPELMEKYHRSKSSIYRIINQHRARRVLRQRIEYVPNDEFNDRAKVEEIVNQRILLASDLELSTKAKPSSITEYLQSIQKKPLLTRDQEYLLFRKYNCIKYLANSLSEELVSASPASAKLKKIESYLAESEKIKKRLIESNLRLVVSIASRHLNQGLSFSDLVSEGNIALMRAIEKFDYSRGFRFSTYASLAIAKDYARKLPAEVSRPDRAGSADISALLEDAKEETLQNVVAVEKASRTLENVIRENLNEKEQFVIINHFGLTGSLIKKKGKSLNEIGKEMRLSKERVRQIELKALQKLRHSLSSEEFELFMGNG